MKDYQDRHSGKYYKHKADCSYLCIMLPEKLKDLQLIWEQTELREAWLHQLAKDLRLVAPEYDKIIHTSGIRELAAYIATCIGDHMKENPDKLAAVLYQTDIPESLLQARIHDPESLTMAIMQRCLQKVWFRKSWGNPE